MRTGKLKRRDELAFQELESFPEQNSIILGQPSEPIGPGETYEYKFVMPGKKYRRAYVQNVSWVRVNTVRTGQGGISLGQALFLPSEGGPGVLVGENPNGSRRIFHMNSMERKDDGLSGDLAAPLYAKSEDVGVVLGWGDASKDRAFDHIEVYDKEFQIQQIWIDNDGTDSTLHVVVKNATASDTFTLQPYLGVGRVYGYRGQAAWNAVFGDSGIVTCDDNAVANLWISTDKGKTWASKPPSNLNSGRVVGLTGRMINESDYIISLLTYNWQWWEYNSINDNWSMVSTAKPLSGGGYDSAMWRDPWSRLDPWGGKTIDITADGAAAYFISFAYYYSSMRVYKSVDQFRNFGTNSPNFDDGNFIFDSRTTFANDHLGDSWQQLTSISQHPYVRAVDSDEVFVAFTYYAYVEDLGNRNRNVLVHTQDGGTSWTSVMDVAGHSEFSMAKQFNVWVTPDGKNVHAMIVAGTKEGQIGEWVDELPLPIAKSEHCVALDEENGRIYVLGGFDSVNALDEVHFTTINLDGTLGTWISTTSLPNLRRGAKAFVAHGHLYIVGGTDGETFFDDVLIAEINGDGTLDSWAVAASFSLGRAYHAIVVNGSYLYVMGGSPNDVETRSGNILSDVQFATIQPGGLSSFLSTVNMPEVKARFSAISARNHLAAFENYLYAFEGYWYGEPKKARLYGDDSGYIGDWGYIYGSVNKKGSVAVNHNGIRIYTLGGFSYGLADVLEDAVVLNEIDSDQITKSDIIGYMPTPRGDHDAVLYNNRIYVIGGRSDVSTYLSSIIRTDIAVDAYMPGTLLYNKSSDSGATWNFNSKEWSQIATANQIHADYYSYNSNQVRAMSEAVIFERPDYPGTVAVIRDNYGRLSIARSADGGITWSSLTVLAPWENSGIGPSAYPYSRVRQQDANEVLLAFSGYGYTGTNAESYLYAGTYVANYAQWEAWCLE